MAFRHHETSLTRLHHSCFVRRSEARLWILRVIRLIKTSLKKLRPSWIFRCPGCRKWVLMAFGHHESWLYRLHVRSFLKRSEGRLRVLRDIRLLKTSLMRPRLSRFFYVQNAENGFVWPYDTFKHHFIDFIKVVFKTSRRQIMSSQDNSPT
jgi:hypothetical protein